MEETLLVILRIIHNAHRRGVIHHLATAEIIVQIVAAVVCTVSVHKLEHQLRAGQPLRCLLDVPAGRRKDGAHPRLERT